MEDETREYTILKIHFGKSLRLLNVQELMNLLKVCKEKRIEILNNNSEIVELNSKKCTNNLQLWENAIDISSSQGNDIRLLSKTRDIFGKPYLHNIFNYQSVFDETKEIFYSFIKKDFDVNCSDINNGETVVYSLIKKFDFKSINFIFHIFNKFKKEKIFLNCFNNDGYSPLYYSMAYHITEKRKQQEKSQESQTQESRYIYSLLTDKSGINETNHKASVNFPVFEKNGEIRSPLGYAIVLRQFDMIKDFLNKGAIINCHEISLLPSLYFRYCNNKTNNIYISMMKINIK